MPDTSTPSPSDEQPRRPRLSLKNRQETQADAPPAAPADATRREPAAPRVKLALKNPAAASQSAAEAPAEAEAPPAPEPATPAPESSPDQRPSKPPEAGYARPDLPFTLPERMGDEPPPLPGLDTPEEESTAAAADADGPAAPVTFDELEPAHSSKPPPPVDAPVLKGRTGPSRRTGRLILGILLVGLVAVVGIYLFALRPAPATSEPPPLPPQDAEVSEPTSAAAPPASGRETAPPPLVAEEATPAEAQPEAAPVRRADPDLAVANRVDSFEISMTRPYAEPPLVVMGGVSYTPGALVDPDRGIRFVGFHPDRREMVFEDARGARYFRYY